MGVEMSATGLEVSDNTLQTANIRLKEVADAIGPERKRAWHALGAVLRALRDRPTLEEAAHLGAEQPVLVRGLYYDQWRAAGKIRRRLPAGIRGLRP
jgi:uncharacterized protein (DUF2267 family)